MAANLQTKPTDLGCKSAGKQLLPSTSTIAICYCYSARKLILSLSSHGGWKAESMGAQPVPKAVYRSGCRDKHNCPWPHTAVPLDHWDLQRQMGVNNLLKVVTRQRGGWESNSQQSSCKSNALTTRLPLSIVCSLCRRVCLSHSLTHERQHSESAK